MSSIASVFRMSIRIPLALFLALVVGGCGSSQAAEPAGTFTVRIAHSYPTSNPRQAIAESFKQIAESRSGGRVKVEIFPASQLFPSRDEVSALIRGDVQMVMTPWPVLAAVDPVASIFEMPGLFPSMRVALSVAEGPMGDLMARRLATKKIELAGVFPVSVTVLTAKSKSLKSLDDVKGLRVRTAPSKYQTLIIQSLGGTPVNVEGAELFTAMQMGQVDGAWVNRSLIASGKLWDVQKNALDNFMFYPSSPVLLSADFLAKLPADLQKIVRDAAKESARNHAARILADDEKLLAQMKEKMQVATLAMDDKVKAALAPAFAELKKSLGDDLYIQVTDAVEKASRPSVPDKGPAPSRK